MALAKEKSREDTLMDRHQNSTISIYQNVEPKHVSLKMTKRVPSNDMNSHHSAIESSQRNLNGSPKIGMFTNFSMKKVFTHHNSLERINSSRKLEEEGPGTK